MKTGWILLGASLLLAGCNGSSGGGGASTGPAEKPKDGKFRVGLITPGPVSDSGWNAMAFQAVKAIPDAEVNATEASGSKIKDAMRSYAQDGYSLVFGHGYEYNDPAIEVAKDFPNTIFISSSGGKTAANVGAFRFYLEQGFYVAGYVAATCSKTGHVAMIGGDDVPSIRSTFKAFRAGAIAGRKDIDVKEVFTGSGQDVAKAKQATLKVIDEGADFVIHQANAAAQGVFDACKERGVWAFGANLDQNNNPSGVVVGSAVINANPAFAKLAERVRAGNFKGEIVLMGMEDDAINFVLNPALTPKLPEGAVEKAIKVRDDIKSGVTKVPKDEF